MKVLLLSDPGSIHTIRWGNALSQRGIEVGIFGYSPYDPRDYDTQTKIFSENFQSRSILDKAKYLTLMGKLKRVIAGFSPDLVHAHYGSSYALLGNLSGFQPFIISVWGTDVYEFPKKNMLFKYILKRNLAAAKRILSTSSAMAEETRKYMKANRKIDVTPFGIDVEVFRKKATARPTGIVTVGTIKTLSRNYGIDLLIMAFNEVRKKCPALGLKLVIGGDGEDRDYLMSLTRQLNIQNTVEFLGKIEHAKVPDILNSLDIFVALSFSESFGVAVIEASACELPTVVSDAGGLPEVVDDNRTGFVVPIGDYKMAAAAIERLALDEGLRAKMGKAGNEKVRKFYDWNKNVSRVIEIYHEVLRAERKLLL